nr:PREDICTED: uncharacterized protein LOC109034295 [Bemisia tabaci]
MEAYEKFKEKLKKEKEGAIIKEDKNVIDEHLVTLRKLFEQGEDSGWQLDASLGDFILEAANTMVEAQKKLHEEANSVLAKLNSAEAKSKDRNNALNDIKKILKECTSTIQTGKEKIRLASVQVLPTAADLLWLFEPLPAYKPETLSIMNALQRDLKPRVEHEQNIDYLHFDDTYLKSLSSKLKLLFATYSFIDENKVLKAFSSSLDKYFHTKGTDGDKVQDIISAGTNYLKTKRKEMIENMGKTTKDSVLTLVLHYLKGLPGPEKKYYDNYVMRMFPPEELTEPRVTLMNQVPHTETLIRRMEEDFKISAFSIFDHTCQSESVFKLERVTVNPNNNIITDIKIERSPISGGNHVLPVSLEIEVMQLFFLGRPYSQNTLYQIHQLYETNAFTPSEVIVPFVSEEILNKQREVITLKRYKAVFNKLAAFKLQNESPNEDNVSSLKSAIRKAQNGLKAHGASYVKDEELKAWKSALDGIQEKLNTNTIDLKDAISKYKDTIDSIVHRLKLQVAEMNKAARFYVETEYLNNIYDLSRVPHSDPKEVTELVRTPVGHSGTRNPSSANFCGMVVIGVHSINKFASNTNLIGVQH